MNSVIEVLPAGELGPDGDDFNFHTNSVLPPRAEKQAAMANKNLHEILLPINSSRRAIACGTMKTTYCLVAVAAVAAAGVTLYTRLTGENPSTPPQALDARRKFSQRCAEARIASVAAGNACRACTVASFGERNQLRRRAAARRLRIMQVAASRAGCQFRLLLRADKRHYLRQFPRCRVSENRAASSAGTCRSSTGAQSFPRQHRRFLHHQQCR